VIEKNVFRTAFQLPLGRVSEVAATTATTTTAKGFDKISKKVVLNPQN
jgi:hypothetical protein